MRCLTRKVDHSFRVKLAKELINCKCCDFIDLGQVINCLLEGVSYRIGEQIQCLIQVFYGSKVLHYWRDYSRQVGSQFYAVGQPEEQRTDIAAYSL